MNWLEIWTDTTGDKINRLCEKLECLGVSGLVIEDEDEFKKFLNDSKEYWDYVDEELLDSFSGIHRVKFYLEDSEDGRCETRRLESALGTELNMRTIKEEDWASNWKAYYRPMEIGRKLIILPSWELEPSGERVIVRLDPGLIFGTGSHPTTKLCLEALEENVKHGDNVLDLGCGSGILGITSVLLGATHVTGCDIDELAPKIARENAALNGVGEDRFKVHRGDILADGKLRAGISTEKYDIILANIVADVIIALAPTAIQWLSEDGIFICSGIIGGRQDEVRQKLLDTGCRIIEEISDSGWYGYICTRDV